MKNYIVAVEIDKVITNKMVKAETAEESRKQPALLTAQGGKMKDSRERRRKSMTEQRERAVEEAENSDEWFAKVKISKTRNHLYYTVDTHTVETPFYDANFGTLYFYIDEEDGCRMITDDGWVYRNTIAEKPERAKEKMQAISQCMEKHRVTCTDGKFRRKLTEGNGSLEENIREMLLFYYEMEEITLSINNIVSHLLEEEDSNEKDE